MKSHIYVIFSVMLWGVAPFLMNFMMDYLSLNLIMEFRFLLGGMILLWITRKGKYATFQFKHFILGLIGVFGYYIFVAYALEQSSVPFVAILGAVLPVLAFITDHFIMRKRILLWEIIATFLSFISIPLFLINAHFKWNIESAIYMILGNALWIVYVHLKKRFKIHDDKRILGYEFLTTAFCFLFFFQTFTLHKINIPIDIIGILTLVFFSTILPFLMYLKGSAKLSLTTSSMYMNMLPVASLLPVIVASQLILSIPQMLAIMFIIFSALAPLLQKSKQKTTKELILES